MNFLAKIVFIILLITEATRSAALAQAGADPKDCATTQDGSDNPLGDKLSQSGGVVCPPNIDPAMKKPTPPTGDKPVIPAPGAGGNSNVQPK